MIADARRPAAECAGAVDLEKIDADDDKVIAGTGSKQGVVREPDAIGWLGEDRLVTANEGDYEGGSRGFTVFDTAGKVLWDSGNLLEHLAMSRGHYPVKRAKSKGVEPEGVEIATFGDQPLIFVNAERGNFVAVFTDKGAGNAPEFLQLLPTGRRPGGPGRHPERASFWPSPTRPTAPRTGSAPRSIIYRRGAAAPAYPTIVSAEELRHRRPDRLGCPVRSRRRPGCGRYPLRGQRQLLRHLAHLHDRRLGHARPDHLVRRVEEGRPAGRLRPGGHCAQGGRRLLGGLGRQPRRARIP